MLWLAAAAQLATAPHVAPAPAGAIRAQPLRADAGPEARRLLAPHVQARLEAVLERLDVIDGGVAWKMRW
jgi:hypothetical protein